LSPESKEAQAFRQGLRDAGYAEGRDVVIEWRSANGDYARVPQLAADLVQSKVDVIVTDTTLATQAVKRATSTIPVVMALVADPVGSHLVASLAHPGGNATGLSIMLAELSAKRLQLLKEAIPRLTRVTVLWNPATPYHPKAVNDLKAVAPSLAIELSFVAVRTPEQFDPAFSAVSRARAQALYVLDAPLYLYSSNDASQTGVESPATSHFRGEALGRSGRADVLRGELRGPTAQIGRVRRQDPEGCQACRPADRAADQVRARGESESR
jgi:ABC-type uncharacterized transport system substrate-binding protein